MTTTALISVTFSGRNGSGAISVPGLLVGDMRIFWYHTTEPSGGEELNIFGQVVTTDGEFTQVATSDLSAETYTAVFLRMA